jgi:L-amino acid N-acyltransferase
MDLSVAVMTFSIRPAGIEDAAAILPIYNYAAAETLALWIDKPSDIVQRRNWLAARLGQGYPVLLAEREGKVVAYASFGDFRVNDGYRHTVENSVYVLPNMQRSGIGRAMVAELMRVAQSMGKHVMVAGIDSTNVPSIRLHESLGFTQTGYMPQVGCKWGRWLDLVMMQAMLDEATVPLT